jgi:hypothetical protein
MTRKVRMFVRLARAPSSPKGWKVDAALKANPRPLTSGSAERELHTVRFAVELTVDDAIFNPADWPMVELELGVGAVDRIALEVVGQDDGAEVEVVR